MGKEDKEADRLKKILDLLQESGPAPKPGLEYRSPWQLIVATVLSAQCTDKRVNMVTPGLFARWPGPTQLAQAPVVDVEEEIHSIGLYRNKAKNLVNLAKRVINDFGGEVPSEREKMESLPGVGRKTASVVLAQGFGIPAFAVDTHVGRVSMRLGFADTPGPMEVEKRMTRLIDPALWGMSHLLIILHGRGVCKARKPDCPNCPVIDLCRWEDKTK